jgi:tripartite ATP-independent transporter DctM subunit
MEIGTIVPILMFVGVLIGAFSGYPIAFVLGSLALIFGFIFTGMSTLPALFFITFQVIKGYVYAAVPLFVFMAVILERAGLADRLFHVAHLLFGGLRGGLAIGTIVICTMFAATTGIVGATVTSMGLLALPAMLKRGYNKALASGTVLAGGTLGLLIPPSIAIVIYGPTANISVAKLFFAAFLPGLVLSALYIAYVIIRCFLQPEMGAAMPEAERKAVSGRQKFTLTLTGMVPVLALIIAVLGLIFLGVATPTEAAATGALAATLLAIAYRKFNWQNLKYATYQTLKITSMVMIVVVGASMFTSTFMTLGGGKFISGLLLGLPFGKMGILLVMMFIIFILGMFIDYFAIILIIGPLFTPIAGALGFDLIWFSLLVIMNLQMANITPPFAYAIFYLRGVAPPEVTMGDIYRGVYPFVVLQWIGLMIVIMFPQIALWLPGKMFGV